MDKINNHEQFIAAINGKNKVQVIFYSAEDGQEISRLCAPFDFGPSRRKGVIIDGGKNKYHFWDYDSDTKQHNLPLTSDKIRSLEVLNEKFDPCMEFDFISKVEWFIPRNW
jgi:hypothetical protein